MDRREFIKNSIKFTIALSAATKIPAFDLIKLARADDKPEPILAMIEGKNYKNIVIDAVDKIGGMKKYVSSGEIVVVKPNIAWDSGPALGANTHPTVVKTVVELCLDAGAKEVKVFDRSANEPRRSYKNSGIQDAVESIKDKKVNLKFVENHKFIEVDIKGGVGLKRWHFYKDALEADKFINVPVAKHHSLSKLTIGMKNIMGVIGGNRGDIHRGINQNLVDINTVVKSNMVIVDATRIMTSNGPTGGLLQYVKVVDKVFASPDIVAADSYGATLFGLKGTDLEYVNIAHKTGLGEKDLNKIKIL